MATTSKQRLALAICDFLSTSLTDGTLQADEKDSIDVAINCISEAFGVDPADKAAVTLAVGSQSLLQIYSVYEKLKNSSPGASKPAPAPPSSASTPAAASSALPTVEQKKQAEGLKSKGNAAMAQKDYPTAIDFYTQALALHPGNSVFLSNRAAAHSAARDHESAKADAEAAVAIDPKYTKAWSRLGLARFALGDAKGSMEAYRKGIEYEGNGGSDAMKKGFETARRRVDEIAVDEAAATTTSRDGPGAGAGATPSLGDLAGMFGGGGAGGGGMPDFGSIMSNPMFASMAQNLMSNPDMMANLMSNPRLREMANQFGGGGGGGGMPDIGSLMSDPSIAEMARNMMGGGGAGGAGRGGPSP
ncbi:small glutamine-rich tetratricopeptide repeat-containing protein 2-like protein [Lasiosphaeris hirsuta]|uniref:Small glutamine-rich tetratricopeptide repeat-containing protein 2-like protein n=1 Tax=Lasiosphaeris hirsuta TaxID=260670 RepID=A0AA40AH03_9PEZI|nr:small glutamine-rich tetratricopeptide repeat-containing protein 2-like protein [Lasiosphaeris hirsuta]